MSAHLKISASRSLPLDTFVTGTQAILAKKGSGKSYAASVQAEELLAARQQIVVVDPTGAWWGLRAGADGTSPGFPIAVLGGDRGDVPLEPAAGEVIADAIAREHFSAVLDLSLFRKGEANRFMAAFLETLYRRNRAALHVFIDEADTVAPQRPFGDEARTLGATEDLVRRGRIRGIGVTLITQRPQVLAKNVLSQVDMLTCLRMNHPKDLGAIREWVDVHAEHRQAEAMIASLPSLPIGEAWLWAPATDLFERVQIRRRRTFDSGSTPKAGGPAAAPRVLAPIDIARLGETIAATAEQAKANDPAALRSRIAELETRLAGKTVAHLEIRTVERPVLTDGLVSQLKALVGELQRVIGEATALQATQQLTTSERQRIARQQPADGPASRPASAARPTKARDLAKGSLPIGEAATLRALIQHTAGLRREQLTVLTGYKRSTRDAYIARLRDRGLVEATSDVVCATREGVRALPDAEPLPTGLELRVWWLERLPVGERAVLDELLKAYPAALRRETIDVATGFRRSTRDAYLSRLAAKQLVEDASRGEVRASATLFEVSP